MYVHIENALHLEESNHQIKMVTSTWVPGGGGSLGGLLPY